MRMHDITQTIDWHFESGTVFVRSEGYHYHTSLECRMIRGYVGDDFYYPTSFYLGESGKPNLRNAEGVTYAACGCAIRAMYSGWDLPFLCLD